MFFKKNLVLFLLSLQITLGFCWSSEDLELFDLVENTNQNFYDVLGVDQKASANDIRKAYRRLSTQYHPDKNKSPDAEETFRKIAAIADVLRNEERRIKYDLILQTGLPDWREPIYYYRRVRNMGLAELTIFLFCLVTVGQYLFAWSAYWEKKYEIEEIVLSRLRKKAKHQRKGKHTIMEEQLATAEAICSLPKPRCQDLFPVVIFCYVIHVIKCTPSYIKSCFELMCTCALTVKSNDDSNESDYCIHQNEVRHKVRKNVKPQYPDYSNLAVETEDSIQDTNTEKSVINGYIHDQTPEEKIHTDVDPYEFKKALKKFPNGTLQRWEKISTYLNCPVSEVVTMAKQVKSQQFARHVPISLQGVTGTENTSSTKEYSSDEVIVPKTSTSQMSLDEIRDKKEPCVKSVNNFTNLSDSTYVSDINKLKNEKIWKQEEQRSLEIALQKYTKEIPARWDRIAEFVQTKTKEECIARYKELAQLVKRKKVKEG